MVPNDSIVSCVIPLIFIISEVSKSTSVLMELIFIIEMSACVSQRKVRFLFEMLQFKEM